MVSCWQTSAELQQILWPLGTKNAIYNVEAQGLDEEVSMAGMRNMILQTDPSALFSPLVVTLAPYVGHPVNVVTCTVANRREAEAVCVWKEVRSTTQRGKGDPLGSPASKYGLTVMLAAVADRGKLDGKSNKILL